MRCLVFVLVGMAVLAGCSSGLNRPVREVTATMGADQMQRVQVTAHSFWFEPNRIVVKQGIPVELKIKNGTLFVPHDFTCAAKEAGIDVDQGVRMFFGTRNVRFTPTQVGEYPFHCDVDGHAGKGMTGVLVVVAR